MQLFEGCAKDANGQIVSEGCGVPAKHPLLEGPPPLLTFHYEENMLDENQSFYANFNLNYRNNIQPATAELTRLCCSAVTWAGIWRITNGLLGLPRIQFVTKGLLPAFFRGVFGSETRWDGLDPTLFFFGLG